MKVEENGIVVKTKIVPNSKEFKIVGFDEWSKNLKIRVESAPEKGKANKELIERLQKTLKTEIRILQGKTTENKKIWIKNYSAKKLEEALKNH